MGTNYYLTEDCECCGRAFPDLHIGKSSGGWCFSLHVIPSEGLNSLDEWESRFSCGVITNEYGLVLTATEMSDIIRNRSWHRRGEFDYRANHAEEGPNGLVRHRIDGVHCVGHGAGTWDYIAGEFS